MLISVTANRVTGIIQSVTHNSSVIANELSGEVSADSVAKLTEVLVDFGVVPKINSLMQQGFPIPPLLPGMQLVNPIVNYGPGFLEVGTDFSMSERSVREFEREHLPLSVKQGGSRGMSHARRFLLSFAVAALAGVLVAQPAIAALLVDVQDADRLSRSTVQATVSVTCDPQPAGTNYVVLTLTLFQGKGHHEANYREGQGGVGLTGVNGLVCDSTAHSYSFPVTLTSFFTDKRFTPGPAGFEWWVASCSSTGCTTLGGPAQGQTVIRP